MKKLGLSVSVVFIMLFVISSIMGAESLTPTDELPVKVEENINVYVTLENLETSEKTFLTPDMVEFQKAFTDDSSKESNVLTYEVGIPSQMLGGSPSSVKEQSFLFPSTVHADESKYKCDSSSSVCATLVFYYQDGVVNSEEWMYTNKVRATWYKYDSSVSWSNAKIQAQCNAEWFDRGGSCSSGIYQGNFYNPNSGQAYEIVPWFSGSGNKTLVNEINYQVASQSIDLHRGLNNWNLSFCIVNGGGSVVYGCY